MRVAAIDCGTNSIRLLIADVDPATGGLRDLVRRMEIDPARIAGLTEHGRSIAVGNPSNLVVIDPERAVTVDAAVSHSLSRNNPWHAMSFTGAVHATILRGRLTAIDGKVQQ